MQYLRFIRSRDWRRLRWRHLRANPLCVDCTKEGRTTRADQVDHRIACGDDPVLQRDEMNLQSLCASHHARKTRAQKSKRGYSSRVGLDGYPLDHRHPAIARDRGNPHAS